MDSIMNISNDSLKWPFRMNIISKPGLIQIPIFQRFQKGNNIALKFHNENDELCGAF